MAKKGKATAKPAVVDEELEEMLDEEMEEEEVDEDVEQEEDEGDSDEGNEEEDDNEGSTSAPEKARMRWTEERLMVLARAVGTAKAGALPGAMDEKGRLLPDNLAAFLTDPSSIPRTKGTALLRQDMNEGWDETAQAGISGEKVKVGVSKLVKAGLQGVPTVARPFRAPKVLDLGRFQAMLDLEEVEG